MTALTRRQFAALAALGLSSISPARAVTPASVLPLDLGPATPFAPDDVVALARTVAGSAYVAPARVPDVWAQLSYDNYRRLGFQVDLAPWRGRSAHVELFAPGLYFNEPIEVNLVEDGAAQTILFDKDAFAIPTDLAELRQSDPGGYSGFKIVDAITPGGGSLEEYLVFQGASYFRSRAAGQIYGLSARGLAIDTAEPGGEEFPAFRRFWIEAPTPSGRVTIHAFLDSPSCTGAFTFTSKLGDVTETDVTAHVFPRRDLANVGIGAQTSMFLFDQTNRARFDDFRPAVHDSDGLLIDNGAGERLWRPLANPRELQVSQFIDENPRGFGLMQRARSLEDFEDFEALYHRRPGLWTVPKGDWGRGSVALVEIPSEREIYDNMVAYWRPAEPLRAGGEYRFDYALHWGEEPGGADEPRLARVEETFMGERLTGPNLDPDGRRVVIDFAPHARLDDDEALRAFVGINRGTVSEPLVQRHPETGGIRLAFYFEPG
ncbi:MAG: glucan biosynthesis protein, partial [Pseudomonadota bacterium]